MPPKRPPPLDRGLFVGDGPLAPGSAPLPPSPSTIHPAYIIDAHTFPSESLSTDAAPLFSSLPEGYSRPTVKSAVEVKLDVGADPAQSVLGVKPFSIHPTVLNLSLAASPSITNIARGAVDIIVPCTSHLSAQDWDLLDEAVNDIDRSWGNGTGKIVISGLLPPPLTSSSSKLMNDEMYSLYIERLSQLSLLPNVFLKALPPVVDQNSQTSDWWKERKEVERVLRMYLSPTIEAIGTHRVIFGSDPALTIEDLKNNTLNIVDLAQPIPSGEWYALLRKSVAELGEGEEAMSDIMGGNAAGVYQLQ
ncbi:hypothetical protein BCR39DRAFT_553579 [Naematelia encephala]|uniref:Amidohydrolase-related domain-containing protein n=1 Tax=Naematelia encephala TaxID=71784 RepID=A0A1Y2AFY6_9TREE|nr:hypothetical protein BCR39DRAFT_553579 [Naematelia encephala]